MSSSLSCYRLQKVTLSRPIWTDENSNTFLPPRQTELLKRQYLISE
jgi:hypothetical protein